MCMMVLSADELLAMVTYTCMTLACQRMFTQHQRQSITCCGFTNIRWYHGLFR